MEIFKSVFDNFMHIRRSGFYMDSIKLFKQYGGTSVNLVNFPEYSYEPENHYRKLYDDTVKTAADINSNGINTVITVGPYPLDYFYFLNSNKDPLYYMKDGIDLAVKYINDGRADALGEIGYPHFSISEDVYNRSGEILEYAMDSCRDYDIPLILHTADMDNQGYLQIENMAKKHYKVNRIIKHHANATDLKYENNILKSVIASRNNIRIAVESKNDFLLETDYTDQKEKPGKVIPPYSVPKRALMIKNEYSNYEEILNKIFIDIPYRFYRKDFFTL